MFSPQQPPSEALLNPAARRRVRLTSRALSRHDRSDSSASANQSFREDRSMALQRRDSDAVGNTSAELPLVRKAPNTLSGKDHDGVIDLTKNDKYRVSKLPGAPYFFHSRKGTDSPIAAYTDSALRYALSVQHDTAYVWQYAVPHSAPHTYSFPLPREPGSVDQVPFPLGALVSPSANSQEPGLVIVMPLTGRIAYWDSVGSAVAEGLFTKKRGVEGKVALGSGESVTSICSAEPAGFILSTSSGRLAHLALRDAAGRPGVTLTFMNGSGTSFVGSFLGALRAGTARRDVVAVKAGKVLRMGEREVVVATARGNFSRWHVNRSGGYANISDIDLREDLLDALSRQDGARTGDKDHFAVLDLEVGNYRLGEDDQDTVQLLVLIAFMTPGESSSIYALVSVEVASTGLTSVDNVHVIKSYTNPLEQSGTRPRLYLPSPRKTAFVVFPRAVVVISSLHPDSVQAMDADSQVFEDVVDFRGDVSVEIVGSGSESVDSEPATANEVISSFSSDQGHPRKTRNPGVVLVAKGAGILRVEAFDVGSGTKPAAATVTVKSKLEQAVFYGSKDDNPLNFRGREEVTFPVEDLEQAALEISHEVLCSKSPYLPALLPSLDGHLELRSQYLRALVTHLNNGDFGSVSKGVLWQLLQDAEKCEAARAVWDVRDERLRENPDAGDGVLGTVIIEHMQIADKDDKDPARAWFLREVYRIGQLISLVKTSVAEQYKKGQRDKLEFAKIDGEANDIMVRGLERAWDFRATSARLYGFSGQHGISKNGLLKKSSELAAPWTSESDLLQALAEHYDLSKTVLGLLWEPAISEDPERRDIVNEVADHLVSLAEICCRAFEERAAWCEQQGAVGEHVLQEGITVRERYLGNRGEWIKPLAEFGLVDRAYEIAESYQDYQTLVEICSEELTRVETSLCKAKSRQQDHETIAELKQECADLSGRLENYFNSFGEGFAIEMYGYLVKNGKLQQLLNGFEQWRERYLTPFLRGNPKYAKLSWIHDVSLGNYDHASNTLLAVATEVEDVLWNKKIEVSIAKLTKTAALDDNGSQDISNDTQRYDVMLELVKLQERLHMAVSEFARGAIDLEAAVQLVTDEFGKKIKKMPMIREMFRKSLRRLIFQKTLGPEELADVLTLVEVDSSDFMEGETFFWALRAIALAGLPKVQKESAERTVWRRCYLRDDWHAIVSTRNRTDEDIMDSARNTCLYTTISLGYRHKLFTPNSAFRPLSPEECFFSETVEEIRARVPQADENQMMDLARDLMEENKRLRRSSKAGLQNWFHGLVAQFQQETGPRAEEEATQDIEME